MAIDTADKRASCYMIALPFGRVFPTPDGTLAEAADRTHLSFLYRGITALVISVLSMERGISRRVHGRLFGRVNRRDQQPAYAVGRS